MTPITMSREAKGLTVEFIRRLKDIATSPFLFRVSFFTSFLSYKKAAKCGRLKRRQPGAGRAGGNSPSQRAMTTQATQFPRTVTAVLPISIS